MAGVRTVDTEAQGTLRLAEFRAEDRDREVRDEKKRRENDGFTQVYVKGWRRLQELMRTCPSGARLYAYLAEHIDGSCGAVVVSQDVIASDLGIHRRTVIRLSADLEAAGAIVRIRVGTGVYAYALDPTEVWKSWNESKETAAFVTKTLIRKSDKNNGHVRRKLKMMVSQGGAT